jgi:voltage-gated potassium channel
MIFSLAKKVLQKTINIEHWKLIILGIAFIVLSTFILYFLEPTEFNSVFNSFWYVMTTVSQVGLGDYIPKTVLGKLYTVILYLVGVGFFAIMIAKWIDLMNNYEELKEDNVLGYTGKNHIVLINWSGKAKITMQEILEKNESTNIVLIDQMPASPITNARLDYVPGDATKLDVLQKANVLQASSICIFAADNAVDQSAEDGRTLLIASTIKHLAKKENSDAYVISEILDEDHITNTNQDYVDQFIISNKPFSNLMASTALQSR